MSEPKTPDQRKRASRDHLGAQLIGYSDESVDAIDAYASACIDEAVTPALAAIDHLLKSKWATTDADLKELRKLLTGRARSSRG